MRSAILIVTSVFFLGCSANPQRQVAREAASALTGSPQTLTAVTALILEGNGTTVDVAQNVSLDTAPKYTVTSFTKTMSFRRSQWRQEQTRIPSTPTKDSAPQMQVLGLDGKLAFNVAADGTPTKLGDAEAQARREELYHHPLGYLLAVFNRNQPVSNSRTEDGMEACDMTTDGVVYTLYIDATTKLPVKITSKVHDAVLGDVTKETSFAKYVPVHGYKLPSQIISKLDNHVVSQLNIERQTAGVDVGNVAAPASIKPPGKEGARTETAKAD